MIDGTEKPKICKTHSSIQRISLQTKLNSLNKLKLQPNISYKNDFALVKIPCT